MKMEDDDEEEEDGGGEQQEKPIDFSVRKDDSLSSSSAGTLSPTFNHQMFHQQQEYIPLATTDIPQTIVHHHSNSAAASVKSEDDISEILDLSLRNPDDSPIHLMGSSRFYEQMIQRIESCFNGIKEEIKHRNQIESQRIAVEVAKFKYLHPYFSYDI